MGHVPAGTIRQTSQGDDLPRRQHRGAGAPRSDLSSLGNAERRALVGKMGERIAARFLADRGTVILGRNVAVGRGEVDLHVRIGTAVVAVEVKTVVRGSRADPLVHFTSAKADQVWSLAHELEPPASRVDVVGVVLDRHGAEVRWIQNAV